MTKEGIYEFIQNKKTSFISSVDEDGFPATRALIQPRLIDGDDIYFATYTSSNVDNYEKGMLDPYQYEPKERKTENETGFMDDEEDDFRGRL